MSFLFFFLLDLYQTNISCGIFGWFNFCNVIHCEPSFLEYEYVYSGCRRIPNPWCTDPAPCPEIKRTCGAQIQYRARRQTTSVAYRSCTVPRGKAQSEDGEAVRSVQLSGLRTNPL